MAAAAADDEEGPADASEGGERDGTRERAEDEEEEGSIGPAYPLVAARALSAMRESDGMRRMTSRACGRDGGERAAAAEEAAAAGPRPTLLPVWTGEKARSAADAAAADGAEAGAG